MALRARCFPGKTLFLNVSPDAFVLEPDTYAAYLGQQRDVVVEIPERCCPRVGDVARRLHQLGVPIALDDFGVGTEDLERLVTLRPEYVKIDRKLVAGLGSSERRHRLIRHLAGLIKAMGATPIAEGVEAGEDAAALPGAGIDLAQGYHFAAPVPRTLFEHEEVVSGNEALAVIGCRTRCRR
ncbi:EAL domain-containing protein [Thermaerobacter sp. PB12/4term]|uniref:EAL domain-containing protein n=1 Tax=Thermaerobacter sp. PB12/4term TaxID=2293838 RepID=UPI000E32BF96|nr:EAL domain-containing protein [Thermaerobacter sp. PB12/4term]